MTESNLEKVKAMIAALRAQDEDKVVQLFDPAFVQHDPGKADGVEGLRQYIVKSKPEDFRLAVVRTIEDAPNVVVQLRSEMSGETIFAIYRFQNGFIAEQWAFSSPAAPPNKSGHTQMDGPTVPQHIEATERNKILVRRYYETFHLAGRRDRNDEFFVDDRMIRHEPGVLDGVGEFLHDVGMLMQHRTIDEIELLAGHGDLVFILAKGTHEGAPCAYVDLYRIQDERVVEHWGFQQTILPQAEANSANSML